VSSIHAWGFNISYSLSIIVLCRTSSYHGRTETYEKTFPEYTIQNSYFQNLFLKCNRLYKNNLISNLVTTFPILFITKLNLNQQVNKSQDK